MKVTSAYANKLLKQLDDEKNYLISMENSGRYYIAAEGEKPLIPDYNFTDTEKKIEALNAKIQNIKHAINLSNVTTQLQVGDKTMSVDVILVRMAQLSTRKDTLDEMRRQRSAQREGIRRSSSISSAQVPEYLYLNYDLKEVEQAYQEITKEIMEMQLALDKHNQTDEFEINI